MERTRCPGHARHWFSTYGSPGDVRPFCVRCGATNPTCAVCGRRAIYEIANGARCGSCDMVYPWQRIRVPG
jgi:hypothetical protein